ncbi:MAG: SRPBCC family protein [Nitrosospira sp.]
MRKTSFLLLMWLVLFTAAAFADPQQDKDIEVKVQIEGENVIVDVILAVPATRQEVWAVLTDFGHMADFVSNLKESKVVSISGNILKIFQRGAATYGLISFPFESTREIRLNPFDKIRSHMISGNMRMMEGTTQLVDEGRQTRIVYHTDTVQENWIPPLVGKIFVEHEIRKQFNEMRNEIIRRKRASASSTPTRSSAGGI